MGMYDEDDERSDLSFARKYRPVGLDGYIGNTDNKERIRRYLKTKRPQSVLLKGHSGCGKTTLARIIAREYMCEDWNPETGACGVCQMCQMFEEYIKTGKTDMLSDVYEIDASDKSGKKDIDSMLESMEYPPTFGEWKTYVIDEAHLLSEGAMGRLLKSLEEPPEGVLIIICTTDPDKLLETIKNRCQLKLDILKPSTVEVMDHLKMVCKQEGKAYDYEGLRLLVGKADNVVRDALNYLETVLSTRGDATAANVSAEFREVNDKIIFDFYKAYLEEDYVGYMRVLYLIKTGYDFKQFVNALSRFTERGIYIINGVTVEGLTNEEIATYRDLFMKFEASDICRVLSELRRMTSGSVEANFMAFIYCKHDADRRSPEPVLSNTGNGKVSIEKEGSFRNNNLELLEREKLSRGKERLAGAMALSSESDIASMFNLEKIN